MKAFLHAFFALLTAAAGISIMGAAFAFRIGRIELTSAVLLGLLFALIGAGSVYLAAKFEP